MDPTPVAGLFCLIGRHAVFDSASRLVLVQRTFTVPMSTTHRYRARNAQQLVALRERYGRHGIGGGPDSSVPPWLRPGDLAPVRNGAMLVESGIWTSLSVG